MKAVSVLEHFSDHGSIHQKMKKNTTSVRSYPNSAGDVHGDRYRAMITNFFIPELNNHDVQELWFQQDGATCHIARATIDLLKDTFGDPLISRFGPVNWPPRSCDLTPLDYFLWDYVKSLVYADKPQTLDYLEDNIRRVIADIRPQMLEKVIENWTSRLDYIRASRDSPMPEIIFKIKKWREDARTALDKLKSYISKSVNGSADLKNSDVVSASFAKPSYARIVAAVAEWYRYQTVACLVTSTTKDPPCRAAMHVKSVES
ncbi:putative LOC100569746 [Trichonephila clavipes]|nr:putative LOC100569746 [Trichonephila clavipes]